MPAQSALNRRSSRTQRQLWGLTLLAVLYLSLHPFTGWALHRPGVLSWLSAGIPRYYSAGDLLVNVLAYAGFGYLSVRLLQARLTLPWAVLLVTVGCTLLSFGMESLQSFLPRRVPSLLDLLANAIGGLLGALLAAALSVAQRQLQARRARAGSAEREHSHRLFALLMLMLWLAAQISAQPLLLVNAPLRPWPGDVLLPAAWGQGQLSGLWLTVSTHFLAMSAVLLTGLLLVRVLPALTEGSRHTLLTVLLLAGIALRISSSLRIYGADPSAWARWLPSVGMVAGLVLFPWLCRASGLWQRRIGMILAAATMALALLVPPTPEFEAALRRGPTLLMRTSTPGFRSLLRAMAAAWPLAVLYFLLLKRPTHRPDSPGQRPENPAPPPEPDNAFTSARGWPPPCGIGPARLSGPAPR